VWDARIKRAPWRSENRPTNREIGERLFISEKTASVPITHAMDKLGALSRYEAAATATRLGLTEVP